MCAVNIITISVHFWSRDKDGGYIIRSTVTENSMLHANITALCLTERELFADRSFTLRG